MHDNFSFNRNLNITTTRKVWS